MNALPATLKEIDRQAFFRGGSTSSGDMTKITISELPNSLEFIGAQAFMYCTNITITAFGGSESNLKHIGF
jgi:hypothetical protein